MEMKATKVTVAMELVRSSSTTAVANNSSDLPVQARTENSTLVAAMAMPATTNVLFSVLAWTGKSELLFATAVVLDDLTSSIATVTFVAFISMLVDRTYTATQYALLASIGTAGRTLFAASSGELVDWLGGDWGTFFLITAVMVTPSLICLWLIRNKLKAMLEGAEVRLFGKGSEELADSAA